MNTVWARSDWARFSILSTCRGRDVYKHFHWAINLRDKTQNHIDGMAMENNSVKNDPSDTIKPEMKKLVR